MLRQLADQLLPAKADPPPVPNLLAAGFAMPASMDLEPDAAVFALPSTEMHD
jgi:hypothetical protein